ncbi:MAG: hypothetical protein KDK97_10185 [Verrucomicrobiales bacterium]|nr:hypothetical protein [Verrucomicrobiales bacterium]
MKKIQISLSFLLYAVCVDIASAATVIYSSNFSQGSGANSIDGWAYNGGVGGSVFRSTTAYDNFDLAAPVGDGSGPYRGDGVKGDGALAGNTGDSVAGNEYWSFALTGSYGLGDSISFSGTGFNANSSFNSFYAVLYNLTDDTELARSGALGGSRAGLVGDDVNPMYDFSLDYFVGITDLADTLEIRFLENHNNAARDVYVDNVSVTLTPAPEPARGLLLAYGILAVLGRRRRTSKQE